MSSRLHKVDIVESLVGTFRVTQPGSSVATSLSEGEAVPKHTGLLEVRGNDFRLLKVPLSQVRQDNIRGGEKILPPPLPPSSTKIIPKNSRAGMQFRVKLDNCFTFS